MNCARVERRGPAAVSSEMETGVALHDTPTRSEYQHSSIQPRSGFLWCAATRALKTIRAQSFVAMVMEGHFGETSQPVMRAPER